MVSYIWYQTKRHPNRWLNYNQNNVSDNENKFVIAAVVAPSRLVYIIGIFAPSSFKIVLMKMGMLAFFDIEDLDTMLYNGTLGWWVRTLM